MPKSTPFSALSGNLCRENHSLSDRLLGGDELYATIVHEAIHSFSVGLIKDAYKRNPGWEEGIVEKLQRLIGPPVLQLSAGIIAKPGEWAYNRYIDALEHIRQMLDEKEDPFYLRLIRIPLSARLDEVIQIGKIKFGDSEDYDRFLDSLLKCHQILMKKYRY